jgi:hypothetical protein
MVVFLPPLPEFDSTEHALLAAGARILEVELPLAEIS